MSRMSLLAAGLAVALLSAPGRAAPATEPQLDLAGRLDRGVLKAGETQRVHVRIGIKALRSGSVRNRPPMNIALVIDRSGSMQGRRIEAARAAAKMAVGRMASDDIISVVSYDDRIEVEVPATKATNPAAIKDRIRRLTARGSTAIYDGLEAGAAEVRKLRSPERVNRIIPLSDGLANVGPSRPDEFAALGHRLAREGITVSTIGLGLGYNEDLMSRLARSADGNHAFVEEPADLAQFFSREFDEAIGVVEQEIEIIVTCAPGIKPVRSLGRDARIEENRIVYSVGQIVAGSEQALIAELEVPAGQLGSERDLASLDVAYRDMRASAASLKAVIRARFADDVAWASSADIEVERDVAALVARERRQEAMRLRDAGRIEEVRKAFERNAQDIEEFVDKAPDMAKTYAPIQRELEANRAGAAPAAAAPSGWEKARKQQREVDVNSAGAAVKF